MTESDAKPGLHAHEGLRLYAVRSKSNRAICHLQWAFPVVAEPIVQEDSGTLGRPRPNSLGYRNRIGRRYIFAGTYFLGKIFSREYIFARRYFRGKINSIFAKISQIHFS